MTIAIVAAIAVSEVPTSLLIVFLVLIVEVIEKLTIDCGCSSLKSLLDSLPQTAVVNRIGAVAEVPPA